MRNLVYLLISMLLIASCSSIKKSIPMAQEGISYRIKKIEKKNSWYIIYADRKDTLYKIVSKADTNLNRDCKKIIVGEWYDFDLKSKKANSPTIGDIKLNPIGYTGCYQYDNETTICLEPKRGIYDLFYTNDLKGICYLK